MKKLLIILMFLPFVFGSAQNLNVSDLITMRKMSVPENKTFLENKGWKFNNLDEDNTNLRGKYIFYFIHQNANRKQKNTLIRKYETDKEDVIELTFSQLQKFNNYINEVEGMHAELESTLVEKNRVTKVYYGENLVYTFKIESTVQEGNKVDMYSLSIKTKSTYFQEKYNF